MISLAIDCVRRVFVFALRGERIPKSGSPRYTRNRHNATIAGETSWFLRRLLMCILSFSRALWVTGHFANGRFFPACVQSLLGELKIAQRYFFPTLGLGPITVGKES